ncbi:MULTISPECIES: LytR/AlgR family response regulator transcription factor [unclassified Chryseobacterium]|uniref:LytR/AlgR family response regulator transcription factor n=1 Tax=unclassified Chryseobacterium TaxID=2593645 RepID=UPI000F4DCA92|nr:MULTISPECIES: LytTR family DNA-binding domain-containing protein [unclassified Chryseobacterium]
MLCNANMEFAKEELDKSDKESISSIRKLHFLRKAKNLYIKALEYNSKTGNYVTKGNILQSLGVIEYTKGNFSLSRAFLDRSIVELTKGKSKKYLVYAYYNYANSYFLEKNYLKSKEWFQKTLDLKIPVYKRKFERHIYERMSESDEYLKNYKAGLSYRKKYDSLNVIINDKEQNIAIHKVQVQNNVKEKDKTISIQKEFIRAGKRYRVVYFTIAVTAFLLALYSFIRWKKIDIKRKRLLSEKQTIEVQHTETLEELQKVKQLVIEDHIVLKNKTRIYLNELVYIKSEGHYLEFYTVKKKEFLRGNISEIITQLPPNFVQSHRSYIVNRNYVISHNTTTVFLKGNYEIPLSRKYKSIFND